MTVIDDYLSNVAEPQRAELERVRQVIHDLIPEATEVISYGMPGFKYKGKYLVGFNAFKDHLSFFPTSGPVDQLHGQLTGYKLSRGTIRYNLDTPLPMRLIEDLVRIRLAAIEQ